MRDWDTFVEPTEDMDMDEDFDWSPFDDCDWDLEDLDEAMERMGE